MEGSYEELKQKNIELNAKINIQAKTIKTMEAIISVSEQRASILEEKLNDYIGKCGPFEEDLPFDNPEVIKENIA